jgi:hypothetical protein
MRNLKINPNKRAARLIHVVGNRQIWEVHYAWLHCTSLMVMENGNILCVQRKL